MDTNVVAQARVDEAVVPDCPGVYVVYQYAANARPLYVGKAATHSLRRRWMGQHLAGRSGGSALRRTLGVYLGLVSEKLRAPSRYYSPEVEAAITVFLRSCSIELYPLDSAEEASAMEGRLIRQLNPVLNVVR